MLKVLLDGLPRPGLAGVPAVTVVTANEAAQAAATERHLRELLGQLGAVVAGPGLVALERHLVGSHDLVDEYVARLLSVGLSEYLGERLAVGVPG
ncbi:hypothetical protein GCM10009835_52160 [Planosporangium flavigriseum]|uniref:Uncharacterized protein n=1 Tax=Planosporangium flavigriseum TaxID=373681 RepID=A0A8J3LPT6_9ACTN|nr:hypothetical protein Pfl04_50210 [Planosporangium flavigriseum]